MRILDCRRVTRRRSGCLSRLYRKTGKWCATIRGNAAIERKRTLDEPDCTRLVIVPICGMCVLDSYTPLASARVSLMLRGLQVNAAYMARFMQRNAHRAGNTRDDAPFGRGKPGPSWHSTGCVKSARRGAAHRS